jgi:lysozyme
MTISPKGIALIEQFEGLRLTAYQDGAGIWTIGYGHATAHKDEYETEAQANADLCADLGSAEQAVNSMVHCVLTQNQFDALTSFTYNEGSGRLRSSTMLRLLNSGNAALAALEFPKWDIVAGAECDGLLKRRVAEQALFLEAA